MPGRLKAFLESEYETAQVSPAYMRLHGKTYLIPYPYVRDYDDFQKAFMNDFFDVMRQDYNQYKRHGEPPLWVHWTDEEEACKLVVPYEMRHKSVEAGDVVRRVFERADKKYRRAVRLSAELAQAYPDRPYQTLINVSQVRQMQKARYEYNLMKTRDKAVYITKQVGSFLAKNAVKATNELSAVTIADLRLKARKWAVRTMLAATVAAAVYTAVNYSEIKQKVTQRKEQKARDPLGNLKMFEQCRDDIKVSLAFAENFAPQAFDDRTGVMTIGYGCTYFIDEKGTGNRKISPVKAGQKISMAEALEQKDRYLNFEVLPQIMNLVKVPLDKPTLVATVNFAYVIGPKAFASSKYLQALNSGAKKDELTPYLTGFRQQKGLLPRLYFMAEMIRGNLNSADLLKLRAEGCYNLKTEDVCVCKNGRLVLNKENFASFRTDNLADNLKKACFSRRSIAVSGEKCEMVENILPAEITASIKKTPCLFQDYAFKMKKTR